MTFQVAKAIVALIAAFILVRQFRKPAWFPGRFIARTMNRSHSALTNWGLKHVPIETRFVVLDAGCGGGKTIQTLASLATEGKVYGIDYSEASVAVARSTNRQAILEGRVDIQQASVSHLPFADGTFDLVTAVETHYYWPDLVADMREVLRVLKPGGRFIVIAEAYKGRRLNWIYGMGMRLLGGKYMSLSEHSALLAEAGFSDIEMFEERPKGWMCGVARRAA